MTTVLHVRSELEIARDDAKKTRNAEVLLELLDRSYGNDVILCRNVANNPKADINVLKRLVSHVNPAVRRIVASRAELFEDLPLEERNKYLGRLVRDRDIIVRENLARHTSDDTRFALYRTPLSMSSVSIRKNCIEKFHNMDIVSDFICKASPETLYDYAEAILSNSHLTDGVLLQFLIISERLNDKHICLLIHHSVYSEEMFGKYVTKFSRKITNK